VVEVKWLFLLTFAFQGLCRCRDTPLAASPRLVIPVVLTALVSTKPIGEDSKKYDKAEGDQKPDSQPCKDGFGGLNHGSEGKRNASGSGLPDGETAQAVSARHF
jgi:hypothetical protein